MKRLFGKWREVPSAKAAEKLVSRLHDPALARVAAADTIDDLIATLRDTVRTRVGADGITIIRRDGDEVVYVTEDSISPLWAGQRFPIQICVSGMAILARTTIVIPDILTDNRVPLNAYLATFVRSMAVVPVGSDAPRLAIGAYWQVAGPVPSQAVAELQDLADHAAQAMARIDGPAPPASQVA